MWVFLILSISDINRQVGLEKKVEQTSKSAHLYIYTHTSHTYTGRGLGQWCKLEHRCRRRPAHSDLCNYFTKAGINLSSLTHSHRHLHMHSHQNSLKSVSGLYSEWSSFLSTPLLSSPNPRPTYLISVFLIPSHPSPHQLSTLRQYLRMHSHFVALHLPSPLTEALPVTSVTSPPFIYLTKSWSNPLPAATIRLYVRFPFLSLNSLSMVSFIAFLSFILILIFLFICLLSAFPKQMATFSLEQKHWLWTAALPGPVFFFSFFHSRKI